MDEEIKLQDQMSIEINEGSVASSKIGNGYNVNPLSGTEVVVIQCESRKYLVMSTEHYNDISDSIKGRGGFIANFICDVVMTVSIGFIPSLVSNIYDVIKAHSCETQQCSLDCTQAENLINTSSVGWLIFLVIIFTVAIATKVFYVRDEYKGTSFIKEILYKINKMNTPNLQNGSGLVIDTNETQKKD